MGTIEQRGKNSWRVREWVKIGSRWVPVDVPLKYPPSMSQADQAAAAAQELVKLQADIAMGEKEPAAATLTVLEFSEIYVKEYVLPNTGENNQSTVPHLLHKRILPDLGHVLLQKLTPITITRWVNKLRTTPKSVQSLPPDQRVRKPADPQRLQQAVEEYDAAMKRRTENPKFLSARTVHHYFACLHAMLEKAVQWGYLKENPADKVDSPKFKKRKMKYLDDDQAVDLLRKLSSEKNMSFRCAVLLALLCGLRLGEVGALTFDDVNFTDGTINIEKALKYTPEKGSFIGDPKSEAGERIITLPPGMLLLLEETMKYHEYAKELLEERWRGTGRIVCAWDGTPLHHDTPSKQWRKFADKNGFAKIRFHELRHSHATLLFANNVDALAVASRLGHGDATTTMREYGHALRRRDIASAQVMQQLIDRASKPDHQEED